MPTVAERMQQAAPDSRALYDLAAAQSPMVRDLDADSVVGKRAADLMTAAAPVLELLTETDDETGERREAEAYREVVDALRRQIDIWYFG